MITKETFKNRLGLIKEQFDLMEKNHSVMTEQNPFVEDGSGVPPSWLVQPYLDHLKTLFAAVNEEALYKPLIPENATDEELEKIADSIGITLEHYKKENQDKYVLENLVEYYVWEGAWGGLISVDGKDYHLENPDELYDYIKTL